MTAGPARLDRVLLSLQHRGDELALRVLDPNPHLSLLGQHVGDAHPIVDAVLVGRELLGEDGEFTQLRQRRITTDDGDLTLPALGRPCVEADGFQDNIVCTVRQDTATDVPTEEGLVLARRASLLLTEDVALSIGAIEVDGEHTRFRDLIADGGYIIQAVGVGRDDCRCHTHIGEQRFPAHAAHDRQNQQTQS